MSINDDAQIDPQLLAAFLDGRLSDGARAELLSKLDASPELRETYADAIAALRDLDSGVSGHLRLNKSSSSAGSRGGRWQMIGMAIAALLVLAVGLPRMLRDKRTNELPGPSALAGELRIATGATRLLDPFAQMRGGSTRSALGARIAIGAGVFAVELRASAGDSTLRDAASRVADQLDSMPGGSLAALQYRTIGPADAVKDSASKRSQAASAAESLVGVREARTGAWLAAATVAAANEDSDFFARRNWNIPRDVVAVLREARRSELDASVDQALAALHSKNNNFASLQTAFEQLLATASR